MAAFPGTIKWAVSSSYSEDLGVNSTRMADGLAHTQTQISSTSEVVEWVIVNEPLTTTEKGTVMSFLRTNFADITLTDPRTSQQYIGKMVSDGVSVRHLSNEHLRLTWRFRGAETP